MIYGKGEERGERFNRSATKHGTTLSVALRSDRAVQARGTAAPIHTSCRRRRRCQPKAQSGRRTGGRVRGEREVRPSLSPLSLPAHYSVEITVWELVLHMRPRLLLSPSAARARTRGDGVGMPSRFTWRRTTTTLVIGIPTMKEGRSERASERH